MSGCVCMDEYTFALRFAHNQRNTKVAQLSLLSNTRSTKIPRTEDGRLDRITGLKLDTMEKSVV